MPQAEQDALARAHRQSGDHIRASAFAASQSDEHVRQSREAVARSLRLLKETAVRNDRA